MSCPVCHHEDSRVLRSSVQDGRVTRRRECCLCRSRWNTVEIAELEANRLLNVEQAARGLAQMIGAV